MFKNIKLVGRWMSLTFMLLLLSDFNLYAGGEEFTVDAIDRSFDSDTTSTKRSKKRRGEPKVLLNDTLDVNVRYEVVGGVLTKVETKIVDLDSLDVKTLGADSTLIDSMSVDVDSLGVDSTASRGGLATDKEVVGMKSDSILIADSLHSGLTRKEIRRLNRDTTRVRHNRFFRDTIPLSRMTAISFVVPGFSQLYNDQTWKIPMVYATTGTALYFGFRQSKKYSVYKSEYDDLLRHGASRDELTPVQTKMIQHNTYRQILFAGAFASYIYFIGDGVMNYDGEMTAVKKATTLSTIFPGAGQIYNKSYWKAPIVIGSFMTMAYVIDFNNRGYKRFQLAYDIINDGDPNTVDEFNGAITSDKLNNYKKSYRRNRDLAIIGTLGLYLLNIVDAHVDAHLRDYDISDDLAMTIEPMVTNIYTHGYGNQNVLGMSFAVRF